MVGVLHPFLLLTFLLGKQKKKKIIYICFESVSSVFWFSKNNQMLLLAT